ncbi:MAG TPA: hypothetical protein DCR90_05735 [Fusobacteriaceae bacterium]|nr:hypothetical protein [Fusobacteriaceae bacterium]
MLMKKTGNIFDDDSQVLVNPVNTEGVMGKGLAFQFKKKYPNNYEIYKTKCKNSEFYIGSDLVYTVENDNKYIINFPTKESWRKPSKLSYITIGLKKLEKFIIENDIISIAIPPLGAGNGGLDWNIVEKEIIEFSERDSLKNCNITIFEPNENIFHLSKSHLLVSKVILKINEENLKKYVSDLVFQKIFFLTDTYGGKNFYKFKKEKKGPFSKTLNILYNELKKYRNIRKKKLFEIEKELEKKYTSQQLEEDQKNINQAINFFKESINHFELNKIEEIEDCLELSSSLIFLIKESPTLNLKSLILNLFDWNERKSDKFDEKTVEKMVNFLISRQIITKDLFGNFKLLK